MPDRARQLVGRKQELALIERALAALDQGRTCAIQLVGEPGIGKTSLIGEAILLAEQLDYRTLSGRGDELQGDTPFGVFIDALDDQLSSLGALEEWLSPTHLVQLGLVFPSLSEQALDEGRLPNDRHAAYRAVRVLLERLASDRPLLLALDDTHWSDHASRELLAYLIRNQPRGGVMILAAQRPSGDLAIGSGETLEGDFHRFELDPLALDEAQSLFGADVDRQTRAALIAESGGNPFYLQQLTRSLRTPEQPSDADSAVPDVPAAVVRSIGSELSLLSEQQMVVLQAASVAGDPVEAGLISEIAGTAEQVTLSTLDELTERDLIRSAGKRDFRFRHPIVRRAVYESAPPGWRLGAHARAAAALEQRGATVEARAHHVERSAQVGDELAIALLTRAADNNAWRAPATAARWMATALTLLPETEANRQRRLELTLARAMALATAGQLEPARDTLRDLLTDLPRELTALRGQAVSVIAMVDNVLSNHESADRLLLRTLHELPSDDVAERTMLRNGLAFGRMFQGDFKGTREWGVQALESARKIDPSMHAVSASIVSVAELNLGEVERARRHMDEAAELIDSMTDGELSVRLHGVPWLAWTENWLDELPRSLAHFKRGVTIARGAGQTSLLVPLLVGQTTSLARNGDLERAGETAADALDLAHVCGSTQYLDWAYTVRCNLEVQAGDLATALSAGENALRAIGDHSQSPMSVLASFSLAEAQLESGQAEQARERILRAGGGPNLQLCQRGTTPHWYDVLVRAELALGDLEAADRWASLSEQDTLGLNGRVGWALRSRAQIEHAMGNFDAAVGLALDGAMAAESVNAIVETARLRALAGEALAAAGRRDEAILELERAQRELAGAGAKRYANEVAQELRGLGRRVQRRGRRTERSSTGVDALTDRELELSRLVATGMTNRQIAAELFISEKTVQNHLTSIFGKLEVSSRAGVAGLIERNSS